MVSVIHCDSPAFWQTYLSDPASISMEGILISLSFKEIQLLPEIFLGISIIYLLIHGTFMSVSPKYLLIQNSVLFLSVLIVSMFCFLLLNNGVECCDFQIFNNTITVDFLSFSSKL